MKTIRIIAAILAFICLGNIAAAQNSTLKFMLPERIIDEFIGRASGETALNHIIEMGAYIHDRPLSEYNEMLFESAYVLGKLKEYGMEGAGVRKYPGGTTWDGIRGDMWEVSPGRSKIADFQDNNAMLASGSQTCDITAELVWVGEGRAIDFEGVDVAGKIIVTSGSISGAHSTGSSRGALGTVSFNSPRPLVAPLAIPITGIGGRGGQTGGSAKFGFFLPPREGHLLRDRLTRGEKITVRAVVESQTVPYNLEVPTCHISGTDPAAGEIIFSAHLFEGLVKQGANDNISGSAAILEIARMLKTMIDQGAVPKPKRTIRFIWVPEFSGTGPWVRENNELMKKTLCNINLDMVGLWLAKSQSFFCLHRTTYGNPHYINDVMEHYYNLVGLGNRAGLAVSGRGGFIKRIVSPSGSDDPFYFRIDDNYGASDHEVFNDWGVGVPGIMMITWPDFYYHTSEDLANKCDATQLKRVAFIGAAAAYTIASADDAMASRIAADVAANGTQRIGKQLYRASDALDRADAASLATSYRLGRTWIEAAVINEKATIASTAELASDKAGFTIFIAEQNSAIDATGKAALASFESYMKRRAKAIGIQPVVLAKPTQLEIKAASMIPDETPLVKEQSYRGYSQVLSKVDNSVREKYPVTGRVLNTHELSRLCNGFNSALDIKKLLDAQMASGETNLQDIINYIGLLSEAGLVKISTRK
ncbi:MAG: M28 family peptidase [Bacteroidetes bacterium]|nr:M28 family peptidase [Bacteroidota bacterium]